MIDRSANRRAKGEEAQGLVELIVALTVLAIGIGSLLTLLTSSALSLQRSDQKGTALVLAEKQIELYRGVGFKDIRLDQTSLDNVANVDPSGYYMAANSSDSSIPVGTASASSPTPRRVASPPTARTVPFRSNACPVRSTFPGPIIACIASTPTSISRTRTAATTVDYRLRRRARRREPVEDPRAQLVDVLVDQHRERQRQGDREAFVLGAEGGRSRATPIDLSLITATLSNGTRRPAR